MAQVVVRKIAVANPEPVECGCKSPERTRDEAPRAIVRVGDRLIAMCRGCVIDRCTGQNVEGWWEPNW